MGKRASKYKRCKRCKELVMDVENCANCLAKTDPLKSNVRGPGDYKRGAPTLDIQEGNSEESF